jgi:hypothetical protein
MLTRLQRLFRITYSACHNICRQARDEHEQRGLVLFLKGSAYEQSSPRGLLGIAIRFNETGGVPRIMQLKGVSMFMHD